MDPLTVLEILPPEILVSVFSYLQPIDILASLAVSKLWNAFHSEFNWKEAYVRTFGEVSTAPDPATKLNWRKLFYDRQKLARLRKLKVKPIIRTHANKSDNIRIIAVTSDHLVYWQLVTVQQYPAAADLFLLDLRALKENPATPREKLITQPICQVQNLSFTRYHEVKDVISIPGEVSPSMLLWNVKKGTKVIPSIDNRHGSLHLNSKYLINSDVYRNQSTWNIFDLSRRCHHYSDHKRQGKSFVKEFYPVPCPEGKCAIIESWKDNYANPYFSQQDLDLLINIRVNDDDYYELELYRVGHTRTSVPIAKVASEATRRKVQFGSENVVRQKAKGKIIRHWLSFQVNNDLYFVDLCNTAHRVKMKPVLHFKFLLNESKVALASKQTLVVFDLENASRCSKVEFQTHIRDISVLPSNGLIVVFELDHVSLCQWATGAHSRILSLTDAQYEKFQLSLAVLAEDALLLYDTSAGEAFFVQL